jgi:hypothetical protein
MRRSQILVSMTGQVTISLIIGDEEDNIGPSAGP